MKHYDSELIWSDRRHILWFPISFDRYRLTNTRLYCIHGLFSQQEHECLLYRILDISLVRKLGNRLCGTGTILLKTSDASDPILVLKNIKKSRAVKHMLSDLIEQERYERGITGREVMVNRYAMEDVNGDGEVDIQDYM